MHRSVNLSRASSRSAVAVIVALFLSRKVLADTGTEPQTYGSIFGTATEIAVGLAGE